MMSQDGFRHIGAIPRNKREEIRVCLIANWSKWRLDIRCWYRPEGQEYTIPAKRGVGIAIEKLGLLSRLQDRARKMIEKETGAGGKTGMGRCSVSLQKRR
jgi:hypothetical protein